MLLANSLNVPRAQSTGNWSAEQWRRWWSAFSVPGDDERVTISTAEKLSPVAAAHRILTNSFALIPFGIYQKQGDARVPVRDEVLDQVLRIRPTPMMSPFMVGKLTMSNAFWYGWCGVWNRKNGAGQVIERLPLPTECCTIQRDSEGLYWYDYDVAGARRRFSPSELSFLFFESYDGIRGRGMKQLAQDTITADGMAQRYNKKFYQNGARIGGIVEVETDASPAARDRIREQFAAFAAGDAFKVAVLDHGMKYTPMGLNQTDAQYIESRGFTVEEISRFTGIPKYMLQTGKEAYNSNAQQRVDYVTDTLLPYVTAWEQENTFKLLSDEQRKQGWYLKGNVSVLLRGDDQSRADFYTKMVQNSIYNPDECRALEEKDPIPGGLGKHFLVTKNLGSLESVLKGES